MEMDVIGMRSGGRDIVSSDSECVFVLDDDKLMLSLLSMYIENAGYRTKSFTTGWDMFSLPPPAAPACLILDMQMPILDGPAVQKLLATHGWHIPVIFISAHATIPTTVEAVKAGAIDFLQKPITEKALVETLGRTMVIARDMFRQNAELSQIKDLFEQLTEREREVLSWIISGKPNKQIGELLGITERTVKAHRAQVMEKLGASSVVDLVRIADKMGMRPTEG